MTKQDLKDYLHNKAEYEYEELDDMSPIQLLAAWCNWEGLLGNWSDEIVRVVEAAYNVKLKNEGKMRHKNLYSVEVCITMDNSGFIKREKTRISALGYNEDDAVKQVQEQLRLSFDVMRHNVELKHDFSHLDNETETVIPKTER